MSTNHKPERVMTAKIARTRTIGVGRLLLAIAIIAGVTTASSPQPALAVGQALVIDESMEEKAPRCGQDGDRECQSVGTCIDLFNLFTFCVQGYTYFLEENVKKR